MKGQNAELLRETHLKQIEEHLSKATEIAKMSGIDLEEMKSILFLCHNKVSVDGSLNKAIPVNYFLHVKKFIKALVHGSP